MQINDRSVVIQQLSKVKSMGPAARDESDATSGAGGDGGWLFRGGEVNKGNTRCVVWAMRAQKLKRLVAGRHKPVQLLKTVDNAEQNVPGQFNGRSAGCDSRQRAMVMVVTGNGGGIVELQEKGGDVVRVRGG